MIPIEPLRSLAWHEPPHGEILRDQYIESLDLTVTAASASLGVSRQSLSELLNGRDGLSPDTVRGAKPRAKSLSQGKEDQGHCPWTPLGPEAPDPHLFDILQQMGSGDLSPAGSRGRAPGLPSPHGTGLLGVLPPSPDMAIRLAKAFPHTDIRFWLGLQLQFDIWHAEQRAPSIHVAPLPRPPEPPPAA